MNWLYLILGLAAGVLSGLFGIGGGIIIVAVLVQLARMPIRTATGTSLGAMLLPVGLLGAIEYYRAGDLDVRASLLIAAGLAVGALGGAKLAHVLQPVVLQKAFAAFLMVMAVRMWIKA